MIFDTLMVLLAQLIWLLVGWLGLDVQALAGN